MGENEKATHLTLIINNNYSRYLQKIDLQKEYNGYLSIKEGVRGPHKM